LTKVKRSLVTAGRIGPQLSALGSDVQPKRDQRSLFGALVLPVLENEIEAGVPGLREDGRHVHGRDALPQGRVGIAGRFRR
jgi:hypothetical protein